MSVVLFFAFTTQTDLVAVHTLVSETDNGTLARRAKHSAVDESCKATTKYEVGGWRMENGRDGRALTRCGRIRFCDRRVRLRKLSQRRMRVVGVPLLAGRTKITVRADKASVA